MSTNKVLIIGVRKQHAHMLKEMYADSSLSLSFLTDNKRHSPISNQDAYDKIISLTKFTSHKMHKSLRSHSGYQMVSGGYSNLCRVLEDHV